MRAAKELLIRGFGSAIPGVSRILSGKTEELDSYLSKIVREYTDHGADSVRFLVKAMENKTPEVDLQRRPNPLPQVRPSAQRQARRRLHRIPARLGRLRTAAPRLRHPNRPHHPRRHPGILEVPIARRQQWPPPLTPAPTSTASPPHHPKRHPSQKPAAIARASKVADNAATRR